MSRIPIWRQKQIADNEAAAEAAAAERLGPIMGFDEEAEKRIDDELREKLRASLIAELAKTDEREKGNVRRRRTYAINRAAGKHRPQVKPAAMDFSKANGSYR